MIELRRVQRFRNSPVHTGCYGGPCQIGLRVNTFQHTACASTLAAPGGEPPHRTQAHLACHLAFVKALVAGAPDAGREVGAARHRQSRNAIAIACALDHRVGMQHGAQCSLIAGPSGNVTQRAPQRGNRLFRRGRGGHQGRGKNDCTHAPSVPPRPWRKRNATPKTIEFVQIPGLSCLSCRCTPVARSGEFVPPMDNAEGASRPRNLSGQRTGRVFSQL